jgi:hypothetical protein
MQLNYQLKHGINCLFLKNSLSGSGKLHFKQSFSKICGRGKNLVVSAIKERKS